jgi:hypothetical protein
LFLSLTPFLWGKVRDPSAGSLLLACYDGLLIVFQFCMSFDFGYYSLAQEMSFVDCYLLYFRQWFITRLLSALLPFQSFFTECSHGDQLLAPPPFSGVLTVPLPLCCLFLFSSLLIIQFFFKAEGSVCTGGYASLSQRWLWEYPVTHILPVGLPDIFQVGLELACRRKGAHHFLSVMWHGEALYGLRIQGVEVLILLGAFSVPSVASVYEQDF